MSDLETNEIDEPGSDIPQSIIIWGIASVCLTLFFIIFNNSPLMLGASFWLKTGAFFVGAPLGLIGALLGDAVRKFAMPSMYFTSGFGDIIWKKIFWKIGPQVVGLFIGSLLGATIVLS